MVVLMDSDFFMLLFVLGGAMSGLGLLYILFGFFCIGPDFSGVMVVLRGLWGRIFGFLYILLGLPVFAYAYGAVRDPNFEWYRFLQAYIHQGNFLYYFATWIIFIVTLHVISFFVKDKENMPS